MTAEEALALIVSHRVWFRVNPRDPSQVECIAARHHPRPCHCGSAMDMVYGRGPSPLAAAEAFLSAYGQLPELDPKLHEFRPQSSFRPQVASGPSLDLSDLGL